MSTARKLSPVGDEIQRHLERLEWSYRRLAEETERLAREAAKAGDAPITPVTHVTISRIIRGVTNPEPATLDAIGRALGVDPSHLMRLAGIPLPTPRHLRDPSAEYISQRLDDLPPAIRDVAADVLGSILDAIYEMYEALNASSSQADTTPPEGVDEETWQKGVEALKNLQRDYPWLWEDSGGERERPPSTNLEDLDTGSGG